MVDDEEKITKERTQTADKRVIFYAIFNLALKMLVF
jgi:hypothetical protein